MSLAYVNTFRDARGKVRHVFRKAGHKRVSLPGEPGSPEFQEAYQRALGARETPIQTAPTKGGPGSMDWLIDSLYASETWRKLSDETQRRRRIELERMRPRCGQLPAATMPAEIVKRIVGAIENQHMRKAMLDSLRLLMRYAVAVKMIRKDDPTAGIRVRRTKSEGFHTWTDEEIDQYRAFHPNGLLSRLVFELALELAARRRDICLLGPQHVRDGRLQYRQHKTGAVVSIEMSPELQAAVAAYKQPNGHLTFTATGYGLTRSYKSLSNTFGEWRAEAGLPKGCVLHGLRKAHCRILAEAGCTEKEIMSHSGHKTMAEVQRYTAAASQRLLADAASAKVREAMAGRQARVVAFPKKRKNR